jgi:hypothetical protein
VQFAADVAQFLDQGQLDVHVHVFALHPERELPTLPFSLDFRQGSLNLLAFVRGQQADVVEHARVGDGAPDVLLEESAVEGDRFRELLDPAVGSCVESTTPGFTGHTDSPDCSIGCCTSIRHKLTQSRQKAQVLSTGEAGLRRRDDIGRG